MADERRSNRKPVSPNDRHYRLLQDLSAPPKPPPPSSAAHEEEVKPSKVKLEGRSRLCKAVGGGTGDRGDVDDIPQFSGIMDFDSSPGYHDHENIDEVSDLNNYQVTSDWEEMWRKTIPTFTFTPDAISQASHDEGSERRRCKRILKNESSQNNKSARTDSTKKVGRSAAIYERLENMMQLIQERHSATMEMNTSIMKILNTLIIGASQSTGAGASHHDVTNALKKLCTLPGLETGTATFYFACFLIEDSQRRAIFFNLPDDTKRVEYIKFMYEYDKHKKH